MLRSTSIAFIATMAILIAIVLPSEYAIDPTGIGRALGLTEMGEIKTQLAEEAAADAALDAEKV
ncbi:transmembrane anchor protein, partial [Acinetobacter baumannii]